MGDRITLTLDARVLGQRRPFATDWQVSVALRPDGGLVTLREVLAAVVACEVEAFRERQQERWLPRVMARAQIERGAALGKIDMGVREPQEVGLEDAVAAALQAFEDRLYLVLLDGRPVETLDSQIALHEGSRLSFVRLVALVGG